MSQFTDAIAQCRKQLDRRFDNLLVLRNQPTSTIDHDAHYAIFRLAELTARQFPSAEQLFPWAKETLQYSLPSPWQTDADPYWLVDCPRLQASYDELLAADDALISLTGNNSIFLFVTREFIIDYTKARVTIEATVPAEEIALLRSIGKITEEFHESWTSPSINC